MSTGLIGKKLGMTSIFTDDGRQLPVTVIQAGPCVVTQIKTVAVDGYNALQLGFLEKKAKQITKPLAGHFQKSGGQGYAFLHEVKVENPDEFTLGQQLGPDVFTIGERVEVNGKTKGRGFSGVIKRHGFGGGRETHGGKCHRIPGSIGSSAWPSKVHKGKKLPGRYGVERKTIKGLEIVDIRPGENLILIKGAVPGPSQATITIHKKKY